jgi:NADPH:quinone reductase
MSDTGVTTQNIGGLVVRRFGNWHETAIETLPCPAPGPGEVVIASEGCALNFQDLLLIEGKYQYKPPLPFFAGRDVAGKIVAIGPGVKTLAVGDRVSAQLRYGAFAELALAPVDRCFRLPDSIDASSAAAAGTVFAAVAVALAIRAQVRAGERVLVTGAAGGVGIAAIQYAKHLGADVVALVSSMAKADAVRRVGADHVIQSDQPLESGTLRQIFSAGGIKLVDVILDTVGGNIFDATIRCLRPGGRVVVVGFASGHIPKLKTNYTLLKEISIVGSSLENVLERRDPLLRHLVSQIYDYIVAGKFSPFITATYPLSQFQSAAEQIHGRNVVGKTVLLP